MRYWQIPLACLKGIYPEEKKEEHRFFKNIHRTDVLTSPVDARRICEEIASTVYSKMVADMFLEDVAPVENIEFV